MSWVINMGMATALKCQPWTNHDVRVFYPHYGFWIPPRHFMRFQTLRHHHDRVMVALQKKKRSKNDEAEMSRLKGMSILFEL